MAFASLHDFLAMGGHAPYVWSAWAVTLSLLLGSVLHARHERRQLLRRLQRRNRRERHIAEGRSPLTHSKGADSDDT